jgi:hypothetical protein
MISLDVSKFTSFDYWFQGAAGQVADVPVIDVSSPIFTIYVSVLTAIFAIGVVSNIVSLYLTSQHPLKRKLVMWGTNFAWIGFLGLAWFSLRQTRVAFFGARFWSIAGLIWLCVIIALALRYFVQFFSIEYSYYKSQILKK